MRITGQITDVRIINHRVYSQKKDSQRQVAAPQAVLLSCDIIEHTQCSPGDTWSMTQWHRKWFTCRSGLVSLKGVRVLGAPLLHECHPNFMLIYKRMINQHPSHGQGSRHVKWAMTMSLLITLAQVQPTAPRPFITSTDYCKPDRRNAVVR